MKKIIKHSLSLRPSTLPDLKYDLDDLAPVLSKESMDLHYNKHHLAYVTNYNKLAEQMLEQLNQKNEQKQLQLQKALAFNLGGHHNHSLYWENLSPIKKHGGVLPNHDSTLSKYVSKDFSSFSNLIKIFNEKTLAIQGSGWGWIAYSPKFDRLVYISTPNQESVLGDGLVPLLTLDVWEHAYYVNY